MQNVNRKTRKRETRLNKIVDAAEKVFFTKGYESTTLEDIAKEADIVRGTLYIYFKSKEDIYMAIAIRGSRKLTQLLAVTTDYDVTGIESLKLQLDIWHDFRINYPAYTEAYVRGYGLQQSAIEASRVNEFQKDIDFHGQKIREALETGIKDGTVEKAIEISKIPMVFFSVLQSILLPSLQLKANMKMHNVTLDELYNQSINLLLRGITTQNSLQS